MAADHETIRQVLALVPQQRPFRFIDDILEMDGEHIVGAYRFREDEYFYPGHFPDRPVTPGVILIETMAQTGVVAFGIYLLILAGLSLEQIGRMVTLFVMVDDCEFHAIVKPGERVIIKGEKVYLRRGNLKTKARMERETGELICSGTLTGRGVDAHET
ncbi:MAG: 3-hydroxyacyl-ACP dehydratase FabZ family protein [Syntrophaceae bacterium]|nr:3-hydroxyacyl-ACP dehydratase FabZ family protein [Syntrophaceae bacterium]